MALVVATLKDQIKTSFQSETWTDCATQFAQALDNFIKSGTVTTTVAGTVTPPTGPNYPAVGTGTANSIVTTGLGILTSLIISKFMNENTLWADIGPALASAISADVATGTVTTTVTGVLVGTGIGNPGCINDSAGLGTLNSDLTAAFTVQAFSNAWDDVTDKIGDAMDTYLKAAIVTTNDLGVVPVVSWIGTGTGSIS